MAHLGETGVDERSAYLLGYDGGQMAILHAAVQTTTPVEATLMGTKGRIRIHPPWFYGKALTLSIKEKEQIIELPYAGNGYNHEAAEVMRCLREGKLESDVMTLDESLSIMQTLDKIRKPWGLAYSMEQP